MKARSSPGSSNHRQTVRAACRIHSGQRTNRRQELLMKRGRTLDGIARAWQRELQRQEPTLFEAVTHSVEGDHGSNEQPCSAEQHDGHGHLPDDKRLADAWRMRDARAARVQRLHNRTASHDHRGRKPGNQPGQHRQSGHIQQHTRVDRQLRHAQQPREARMRRAHRGSSARAGCRAFLRRSRAACFRPAAAGQSHRARRRATCESQFPAGERQPSQSTGSRC